jgi:hypothetical protein
MLFNSARAASWLSLCSLSSAASLPHKRATESGVSLFVYGTDSSGNGPNGGPIIYVDGMIISLRSSSYLHAEQVSHILEPRLLHHGLL